MSRQSNNFIDYRGVPITGIAGVDNEVSAIGILAKYNFLIVKPHSVMGTTPAVLEDVIRGVKAINPRAKFFGYTTLGTQANIGAYTATVDAWITDIPTQGIIDGIFIDNFGFDQTLSTRVNQNLAVTYVYNKFLTGTPLQVAVQALDPLDALETYEATATPVIGTGAGTDYIVLDNFYFSGATPTNEAQEHMYGRLEYATAKTKSIPNAIFPKLGVLLGVSAGTPTTSIPGLDYSLITNLANIYCVAGLGVMPSDKSAATFQYYYTNLANTFSG